MERRRFLRTVGAGSLAAFSLSGASVSSSNHKLTILHTNDTHSHIDPFPADHAKYPGQGGIGRRKHLVDLIRQDEKHVLLLDAGDIFQGTPYFNVHGGELELKLMTELGYDASAIGNHDFDGGMDGFLNVMAFANFPFLCANYNFENTVLKGRTKPYHIFQKGRIKVGVFGLGVELDGLVSPQLYGDTVYTDPVVAAQKYATQLKKDHHCNLVVCLSHLGYHARLNPICDTVLASQTKDIDVILGGHTHTFLPKAELHKNANGNPVLINQAGWAGLVLGRIDFYFDKKGNPDLHASAVQNTNYQLT